jgi:hypothetical protein
LSSSWDNLVVSAILRAEKGIPRRWTTNAGLKAETVYEDTIKAAIDVIRIMRSYSLSQIRGVARYLVRVSG